MRNIYKRGPTRERERERARKRQREKERKRERERERKMYRSQMADYFNFLARTNYGS
jgi:hypothetical protein